VGCLAVTGWMQLVDCHVNGIGFSQFAFKRYPIYFIFSIQNQNPSPLTKEK